MTHQDWLDLVKPIISALILAISGVLTLLLAFGTTRLRRWLDAKNQAATSALVADASVRMQTGMANAAGRLALGIQQGTIDPTSVAGVRRAAATEAAGVEAKFPDALAALRPLEGAVLDGILGKLGTLSIPVPVIVAPVLDRDKLLIPASPIAPVIGGAGVRLSEATAAPPQQGQM